MFAPGPLTLDSQLIKALNFYCIFGPIRNMVLISTLYDLTYSQGYSLDDGVPPIIWSSSQIVMVIVGFQNSRQKSCIMFRDCNKIIWIGS